MTLCDYKRKIEHLKRISDENEETFNEIMLIGRYGEDCNEYINSYMNNTYLKQKEKVNEGLIEICSSLGIYCETIDQLYALLVKEEESQKIESLEIENVANEYGNLNYPPKGDLEKFIFDMTDESLSQNKKK